MEIVRTIKIKSNMNGVLDNSRLHKITMAMPGLMEANYLLLESTTSNLLPWWFRRVSSQRTETHRSMVKMYPVPVAMDNARILDWRDSNNRFGMIRGPSDEHAILSPKHKAEQYPPLWSHWSDTNWGIVRRTVSSGISGVFCGLLGNLGTTLQILPKRCIDDVAAGESPIRVWETSQDRLELVKP